METTQQNQFKDEELKIAEDFNIEPATVRQIGNIFSETIKGICKLVAEQKSKKEVKPEAVPAKQAQEDEPKSKKQNYYSENEKALAEKYKVEPKLCRLIADIVCEQTEGICNLIKFKQQLDSIELQEQPEAVPQFKSAAEKAGYETGMKVPIRSETDNEPKEKDAGQAEQSENDPDELAERLVVRWLRKQSYTTMLVFSILNIFMMHDHGTSGLANEIANEYMNEVVTMAETPRESLTDTEKIMTGIATELAIWRKHYWEKR